MQESPMILATVGALVAAQVVAAASSPQRLPADLGQYQLNPLPPPLEARRGVHPRLFLDTKQVEQLRAAITSTYAPLWKEVLEQADRSTKKGPPPYIEHDKTSGDEQLWQREVGNAMPPLAMAWLLTGDRKYLDAARAWALASCAYPTWGLGRIDGKDLAAGHQLFGLAITYDWCGADLGEAARRTIRETIIRRGSVMFASGKARAKIYLQNHLWVSACGLATAGLAVYDEYADASLWIGLALDQFRRTSEALGPDGASHEGVGYWGYGVEYLLKFMHLARELLGVDLYDRAWWRNTAAYRLYLSLPRNAWTPRNSIVDIADCPRSNWYGPDYLLRCLAREFRDGHAQWLAAEIDEANVDSPAARWLNLVWFDPLLKPLPPVDLPTLRHFTDMGIVSARTDWSGDESLVVFKCGPPIGHEATDRFDYDPGGGHAHPDANHFVLFGNGEWLLRDDGYLTKHTGQHNTLLVDGRGQLGEGAMWFRTTEQLAVKAHPRVLQATSAPDLNHIVGDATGAYPLVTGLRRFVRHLLFLKPNVLIVADDIAVDQPHELEIRFHPEQHTERAADGAMVARAAKAMLRIEPLTLEGVEVAAEDIPTEGQHGQKTANLFAVVLRAKRAEWRNAVALSWSAADASPPRVTFASQRNLWKFTTDRHTVALDWDNGRATTTTPAQ